MAKLLMPDLTKPADPASTAETDPPWMAKLEFELSLPEPVTEPSFKVKLARVWLRVPMLNMPPFIVMLLPVETELLAPRARIPEFIVVTPV